MAPRTRSKKKQSRLDFAPLPSSSPNQGNQPESVHSRAAAVTISPSPRKKRKTSHSFLPTPAASSQPKGDTSNDVEIIEERPSSSSARLTRSSFMGRGRREDKQSLMSPSTPKSPANIDLINIFDDSESDLSQSKSKRHSKISRLNKSSKVKDAKPHGDSSLDESNEDESPKPTPIRASANNRPVILSDDDNDDGNPEHLVQRRSTNLDFDDSDSDIVQKKPRRKTQDGLPTPKRNHQEEEDLREDLEFLRDSSPEEQSLPNRKTLTPRKNAKQSALDKLKAKRAQAAQRRAGQSIPEDSHCEADDTDEEDVDNDDGFLQPQEDDEDFIIEDDDDAAGNAPEIPLEFKLRTMKPRELFKFVVEWMVQKKLNPGFDKRDEVYHIAFSRLNDFVRGMGGSKFQSSAWTPGFTRALNARPELVENHVGGTSFLSDHCDACNRSNHPATFDVQFQGHPYDKGSLEDFSDDEDDPTKETALPSSDITYSVGKFCMRNARVAHALAHWKYHLNEWVVDFLKGEGHCTADKVLDREDWSMRRRRDYALSVVDGMEEKREVKNLYRDFKNEIETAQNAEDPYGHDIEMDW